MTGKPLTPYRDRDLRAVLTLLAKGHCVSVVGMSNFGKSTLLRLLQTPTAVDYYHDLTGANALFVYVDCNRMLELSRQGFFEATLRAVLEALPPADAALHAVVEAQYQTVVQSPNEFAVPLAFNNALVALVEEETRRVVLLLDEFDDVLTGIEPRILLNLRALRDKYGTDLSYVIASVVPPSQGPPNEYVAEFAELFAVGKYALGPLSLAETRLMAAELFEAANDALDEAEARFVLREAGGHPGLIQAVVRVLLQVESGAPQLYQEQAFALVNEALEADRQTLTELNRLWAQLDEAEQQFVLDSVLTDRFTPSLERVLRQRGLINVTPEDETPRLLGELFTRFVRRKALMQPGVQRGVRVDTDSGEVWVDGLGVDSLTDLEYRLLLLLYGRLDKICDKYQLVGAVWGEDYIDHVDDARIEKLVSRVRAKLEGHPDAARYLITVRGRGYKLSSMAAEIP
ncbi:winged helix-turn-helix domain-containing protein [Chloroflexota bacterium]